MTNLAAEYKALADYRPANKVRFVTATSLFDGHHAAIDRMPRPLQARGAEAIHLGHNRSVDEVVTAALQEDAQGIAISACRARRRPARHRPGNSHRRRGWPISLPAMRRWRR